MGPSIFQRFLRTDASDLLHICKAKWDLFKFTNWKNKDLGFVMFTYWKIKYKAKINISIVLSVPQNYPQGCQNPHVNKSMPS